MELFEVLYSEIITLISLRKKNMEMLFPCVFLQRLALKDRECQLDPKAVKRPYI